MSYFTDTILISCILEWCPFQLGMPPQQNLIVLLMHAVYQYCNRASRFCSISFLYDSPLEWRIYLFVCFEFVYCFEKKRHFSSTSRKPLLSCHLDSAGLAAVKKTAPPGECRNKWYLKSKRWGAGAMIDSLLTWLTVFTGSSPAGAILLTLCWRNVRLRD